MHGAVWYWAIWAAALLALLAQSADVLALTVHEPSEGDAEALEAEEGPSEPTDRQDDEVVEWEVADATEAATQSQGQSEEEYRTSALLERLMEQYEQQGAVSFDTLDEETAAMLREVLDDSSLLPDDTKETFTIEDLEAAAEELAAAIDDLEKELAEEDEDELEPTSAFLDLEDAIVQDGYTPELVEQLSALAEDDESGVDAVFALEHLAYMQLFEPQTWDEVSDEDEDEDEAFTNALALLRMTADAGVRSAKGIVALLELIDVEFPPEGDGAARPGNATRDEKLAVAEHMLLKLSAQDDLIASLAVAYRHLSGRLTARKALSPCLAAARLYHKVAESNVLTMDEEGGERFFDVVRLSEEAVFPEFTSGYDGELRDRGEAAHEFAYYRTAAANPMDEQFGYAHERLGEMYYFGDDAAGVRQDHAAAAEHFRVAAELGEPVALANYGMMLASGLGVAQDNKTALALFERAAMQGSAFALHGLGVMHLAGSGVPANATRARLYFEEAVDLGFTESHTYLGTMYLHGDGVAVDHARAFEHFELASAAQSSQSLFNLGVMHFEGIGTPRSCPLAVELFRSVALQPDLLSSLPFSLVKGYECVRAGDFLRAYLHFRLVAELGDDDAQCNAAYLLEEHGEDIFKHKWLTSRRSQGEDDRDVALLSPMHEAFALYEQAAALNDSEAVRKLGACFYEPWPAVCPRNRSQALVHYTNAAALGDAEAAYTCGVMYLTGEEVEGGDVGPEVLPDWHAAREYFVRCSAAEFPRNVPCYLAVLGTDAALTARWLIGLVWS